MKNQLITLMAGLTLAFTSCVDMDMVPKSQGNSGSWYTTETELKMAVNEFYILGYWNRPLENSEQWTDNFTYRNTNRNYFLDGTIQGQQYEIYSLWQQSYKLIARANTLLESIERAAIAGVADKDIRQYEGEAYFSRACKYAELLCYYGDLPYMDKYMTITEAEQMGRMPKAELIPLVYADFDKAIEYLPVSYTGSQHFTKGAAYAMKARFALYFSDWAVAAKAAKDCMDLKVYSLEPTYSKLFLQSTRTNAEKIFTIPRSIANEVVLDQWFVNNGLPRNAGGYAADTPSWDLLAAYLCTDGKPIDESELFDPLNPFKNRDPRCTATIVEFNTEHCGFEYDPSPVATQVMNYTTGKLQSNQDTRKVAEYASFNGLVWKKGIDISWTENGKQVDRDYMIMRYADVLLMYAEAKIELNEIDDSVLEAINKVRARAYGVDVNSTDLYPAVTVTDQTLLRKALRIERRMELANESLRYMDLIRWRLAEKALNGYNYINLQPTDLLDKVVNKGLWFWSDTPSIDEDGLADFTVLFEKGTANRGAKRTFPERQYLWPIPTQDMQLCPNMKNNDGY